MSEVIYTDRIPYTYLIKFIPTDQVYYGVRYKKGCHPKEFWQENGYFTSSKVVHELIDEYGPEWFEYEIRQTFDDVNKALLWEETVLQRMEVVKSNKWLNRTDRKIFDNRGVKKTPEHIEKVRQANKGKNISDETRQKLREANLGKKQSKETIEKRKQSRIENGYTHSLETRNKISESHKGKIVKEETKQKLRELNLGKQHSEKTKQKISEIGKGRKHTEESKNKMRIAKLGELNPCYGRKHSKEIIEKMRNIKLGKLQPKITCPHCNFEGGASNMKRYHFDNCKNKDIDNAAN